MSSKLIVMKLYQYPNCSTCRKAVKFLNEKGVVFESIDITHQPPSMQELQIMLASNQGNIRKLFNTSGLMYRELNMKERLPTMDDREALALLSENGKLIKRPFLLYQQSDGGSAGTVGFKQDVWQALL